MQYICENNPDNSSQTLLFQPNRPHLQVWQTVQSPKYLLACGVLSSAAVHFPGTPASPVTLAFVMPPFSFSLPEKGG